MTAPTFDIDLTFSQSEASIILKEYVCAVCLSELSVTSISGSERVFIICPLHSNVCLSGRVMRSTANMQVERSSRDYYPMLAAFPDLYGNIWKNGIPESEASKISRHFVCSLCSSTVEVRLIRDQYGKLVSNKTTLVCHQHGNVGLNGIGMARQAEYPYIPPIKWRAFLRTRQGYSPTLPTFESLPDEINFEKLGVVTYGNRLDENKADDHFHTMFFSSHKALADRFLKLNGEKPSRLRIRIPSSVLTTVMDCYVKGALTARAVPADNGWRWDYYRDPYTQEIEVRGGTAKTLNGHRLMKNPVDLTAPIYQNSKKKEFTLTRITRLRMVMPELAAINGKPIVGYFEISFRNDDGIAIEEGVKTIQETCFEKGRMINEVPLILSLHRDDENKQFVKIEME